MLCHPRHPVAGRPGPAAVHAGGRPAAWRAWQAVRENWLPGDAALGRGPSRPVPGECGEGTRPTKKSAMNFPAGVQPKRARKNRLTMRYIDSGPEDGVPVVMIHGNLSTGRFYEHLIPAAPAGYRLIAPDMRGFGDTERSPIDATRRFHHRAADILPLG